MPWIICSLAVLPWLVFPSREDTLDLCSNSNKEITKKKTWEKISQSQIRRVECTTPVWQSEIRHWSQHCIFKSYLQNRKCLSSIFSVALVFWSTMFFWRCTCNLQASNTLKQHCSSRFSRGSKEPFSHSATWGISPRFPWIFFTQSNIAILPSISRNFPWTFKKSGFYWPVKRVKLQFYLQFPEISLGCSRNLASTDQ